MDVRTEKLLEAVPQLELVRIGAVERHHLVAVAAEQPGVIADEDGDDDGRHQRRAHPARGHGEPTEQAEGQRGEVVGDLRLVQSRRSGGG